MAEASPQSEPSESGQDARAASLARTFARRALILAPLLALVFGLPWWVLVGWGGRWPHEAVVALSALFVLAALLLPVLMVAGHGPRGWDAAARIGSWILAVISVLFVLSLGGVVLHIALGLAGMSDPMGSRVVAAVVLAGSLLSIGWGAFEARRVPRLRAVDVTLERLGEGLDGLRIVQITDTHVGLGDRTRWLSRVVHLVNELDADIVCHTGDVADGMPARRRTQVEPLAEIQARVWKVYVPGNHEHFQDADQWCETMRELGWQSLRSHYLHLERDGASLVIAGVDDADVAVADDYDAALAGAGENQPVVLLAHQPSQVAEAASRGVDLQLSGHTHGGQIWPFHWLVRLRQPSVQGLTRHGERTWLYTSRGTGFWGPPLRLFAPSEITVLTLHSALGGRA